MKEKCFITLTPGHDLADVDPGFPVTLDAVSGHGAVTFRLARDLAADANALGEVDEPRGVFSSTDDV